MWWNLILSFLIAVISSFTVGMIAGLCAKQKTLDILMIRRENNRRFIGRRSNDN